MPTDISPWLVLAASFLVTSLKSRSVIKAGQVLGSGLTRLARAKAITDAATPPTSSQGVK